MALKTLPHLLSDDDLLRDAFADLGSYPDVTPAAVCRRANMIGLAGESLVDSILLRHGLFPSSVPGGSSADRLIPLSGRAARLQVKTRTHAVARGYEFRMRKGYRGSPAGCRGYAPGDFDIAALVALPINVVMFTAIPASTLVIPAAKLSRLAEDPLASLDTALRDLDARGVQAAHGVSAC